MRLALLKRGDISGSEHDLELAVGEEVRVEFPSLSASGYRWRHEMRSDGAIAEVTWQADTPRAEGLSRVGRSAPEIAAIRGMEVGEVRILFRQQRPWESKSE